MVIFVMVLVYVCCDLEVEDICVMCLSFQINEEVVVLVVLVLYRKFHLKTIRLNYHI